jgi:hypothetical protein
MKRKFSFLFILIFLSACEKTNDNGEILKFYGDIKEDIGYSVAVASDGYFIGGQLTEISRDGSQVISSSKKPGIIKTGLDGNAIWEKYLGGRLEGSFSKVIVLSDGSVAAAGQVTDTVTLKTNIFVVKIKADGTGPIEKTYPLLSGGNQTAKDLLQTFDGSLNPTGFIILGTTDVARTVTSESVGNIEGKLDILLLRIDNNLQQLDPDPPVWGFPENDEGVSIKQGINGAYIITGFTERYKAEGNKHDILMMKTNSLGIETGYRIIGGADDEYAADFEVLNDGYVVAGNIGAAGETQSVFVKKISLALDSLPIFSNSFVQSSSWSVNAISKYKSSSFVLAGQTGTTSQSKMLIFAIDALGNLIEDKEKITGSTGVQAAYDVVTDSDNNIITIGKDTFGSNSMISLLKFRF